MENIKKRVPRTRNSKGLNALAYFHIEHIFLYLNLRDLIECLRISQNLSLAVRRSSFWEKYLYIRRELKAADEVIKENNNYAKVIINKYNNAADNSSKSVNIKNSLNNRIIRSKNDVIKSKELNEKFKVDWEKFSIEDYLRNDGKLIKNWIKSYKINQNDAIKIFSGIILNLLQEKEKAQDSKKNDKKTLKQQTTNTEITGNSILNRHNTYLFKKSTSSNIIISRENSLNKKIHLQCEDSNMNSGLVYLCYALLFFPQYSKLDLSYNDIDSKYMHSLSFCLQYNTENLAVINLSNNNLNDLGCKLLFANLIKNKKLSFLNLTSNEIGSVGVEHMVNFLEKTESLQTLILQNNLIGPKGAIFLAGALVVNQSLRALNISYNGISSEGTRYLINLLKGNKKIQSFYFGGNYILSLGTKFLIEGLKLNKMISYLFLEWNHIGIEGAEQIAELISSSNYLSSLGLQKNNLTDAGIEKIFTAISMRTRLVNIDISHNNITSSGIKIISDVLKDNKTVGGLSLESNDLSGGDWKNPKEDSAIYLSYLIKNNSCLRNLNLSYTNLSKSVVHIFEILKENKTLYSINLSGNHIGSISESFLESFKIMLKSNKNLNEMNLDNNYINDTDIVHIAEGLIKNKGLKTLTLRDNLITKNSFDILVNSIKNNKNIFNFILEGNSLNNEMMSRIDLALNFNKNMKRLESHLKGKILNIANYVKK